MNTAPMFSSHLIPVNPNIDRPICSAWKTMNQRTRWSKPKSVAVTRLSAPAPTQLWKPYQTSAGTERTSPGILVPANPNELRTWTTKGIPYL